jgi:lipopolysaccharide assembly outer membrane protein LptD (OstA)
MGKLPDMMSILKRSLVLCALCAVFTAHAQLGLVGPDEFKDDFNFKQNITDLSQARTDEWTIVDKNVMLIGNVYVPFGRFIVYADKAIINTETKDLEATGNIRLYRVVKRELKVTIRDLIRMRNNANISVTIKGYEVDPLGNQMIAVEAIERGDQITAERVSGNLETGAMEFTDVNLRYRTFGARAPYAIRKSSGELEIHQAEISSCEYMCEDNEHYLIYLSKAVLKPYLQDSFGFDEYNPMPRDHSILGTNAVMKVYGIPVFWLPFFYKPKDEAPGFFGTQFGSSSDFGYFVKMYKRFDIWDDPYISTKLFVDYYSRRGVGYGNETEVTTEDSHTYLKGYSIYDLRPYESSDVEKERLEIPHYRYNFELTNVSHLTSRLDFRGSFNLSSDYYFRYDFDRAAFDANPEPSTYAALEYQFDRFSTSLYSTVHVNKFYTTVERLPEWRLDIPRQELFGNIYYQGETSIANLRMNWREFDKPRPIDPKTKKPYEDNSNYHAFRFDSLHMFYYPIKFSWFHLTPRAGFRMTYYDNSSKDGISAEELGFMSYIDREDVTSGGAVRHYDSRGGRQMRFAFEVGFEANTKIYQAWQDVRNAYFQLDGLRHVMEPYVNYTYIPEPTVDRDNLYFFDDVDRITQQNFARIGMRQRLQTRRGDFGNEQIYNWMTLDTYWDYHFQKQSGFNNVGDLVTRFNFKPQSNIDLYFLMSIDAGQNSDHDTEAKRGQRYAGRPGIGGNLFNKLETGIRYTLFEGCTVNVSYNYNDPYHSRPAYSMGSTFFEVDGGGTFDRYYTDRTQQVNFGITMPLWPDHSFRGAFDVAYDFELGYIKTMRVRLIKTLHCFDLAFEAGQERKRNSDGGKEVDYSFSVMLYLNGLTGPLNQMQNSASQRVRGYSGMGG